MRKASKFGLAATAAAVTVLGSAGVASAGSGGTAVPAGTAPFDSGNCTAQFVRSASGIVNETNRVCNDRQNPWTSYNVYLQFRPLNGTPNPACDPAGLVPGSAGTFSTTESTITKWFGSQTYNVCVYFTPNQIVAANSVSANNPAGTGSLGLPVAGQYRIDVSGTWQNSNISTEDAEYTSVDGLWDDVENGYNHDPFYLGEGFGDLMVNGTFVDWGAYNGSHAYSLLTPLGTTLQLNVFDGDSTGGNTAPNVGWYGDNTGSLSYTVTYLGQ